MSQCMDIFHPRSWRHTIGWQAGRYMRRLNLRSEMALLRHGMCAIRVVPTRSSDNKVLHIMIDGRPHAYHRMKQCSKTFYFNMLSGQIPVAVLLLVFVTSILALPESLNPNYRGNTMLVRHNLSFPVDTSSKAFEKAKELGVVYVPS